MNRYRVNGQEDDASIVESDTDFLGVDLYNGPENLGPGLCQAATNIDFTTRDAVTRGGLVCLPSLGLASFNASSAWLSQTSAADKRWFSVAYGNGYFVAVAWVANGTNDVMRSADGITWTVISTGFSPSTWRAITYGNGLFVAVGDSGTGNRVMTSPDGNTWTRQSSAADNTWSSITYGNNLFVALSGDGGTQQAMTSPDGITWTLRTTLAAQPNTSWSAITYGNGIYVAVGLTGAYRVMTSSDGITWAGQTTTLNTYSVVAYGNSVFAAVATTGASAITSSNGITWQDRSTTTGSRAWSSMVFGNGLFVAVNTSGVAATAIMSSPNGINWTDATAPSAQLWGGVAYGNGTFVAVPSTASAATVMTKSYYSTPTTYGAVLASGVYSDPNSTGTPWIVLVGSTQVGFYSFGQTTRTIAYPAGYVVSQQSTIVQANNLLFIFSGSGQSPIQWDGTWGGAFVTCPVSTLGAGYENIPFSNQATYYQNRLWVTQGKDTVAASQNLDFANFNLLTSVFNLNVGTSDYVVCTYPFGNNGLVVFKNKSSYLLQNVNSAALGSVTSTEITRQVGIIGINAVTAVGPDLVYMTSDRNITSIRLNIQNATQAVTIPISQKINPIMRRVNWNYGYKVSLGYWNNLLFVALPLDNATICNTILVYNFITNQWYGEWNFNASINMAIQGFVTANYLGRIRMHVVTEDGRIFVTDEGQNDISGTTVAEIATSLTTRAYSMNNDNRFTRRLFLDLSTNRPNFSCTAYVDGASESSAVLTNQTYARSQSRIFNDSTYDLTNASNNYNRAGRKDYSTGPASVQCGTGFQPEMMQDYRFPIISRMNGRLQWLTVTNSTGILKVNSAGFEARAGYRNNLVQVL